MGGRKGMVEKCYIKETEDGRELIFHVGEKDIAHNSMGAQGLDGNDYDWNLDPNRVEHRVVARFDGINPNDLKQMYEAITHYTHCGLPKSHKHPGAPKHFDFNSDVMLPSMGNVYDCRQFKVLANILDACAFDPELTNLQIQEPGMVTPLHTDKLSQKRESCSSRTYDETMRRMIIFLDDWKLGQSFQIGNQSIEGWKSGEMYMMLSDSSWNHNGLPHGGINMGYFPRFLMNLTGTPTEETFKRMPMFKEIYYAEEIKSELAVINV